MKPIDLLLLPDPPYADVLRAAIRDHRFELHFNGRLVWGDIVRAIALGRDETSDRLGVPDVLVEPLRLDIALYLPEEKALYVAVDYRVPGQDASGDPITVRVEKRIACGAGPGTVELSDVSVGTSAKVLDLLDALDLTQVHWLPLRA